MFDPLPICLVVKFGGPVAVVTVDTHPLVVYLSPDRQSALVIGVVLVLTSWTMASLTLDTPEFRRDFLADKSLGTSKTRRMTLQTIGIILHPTESGEGIGVRVFFPFFEVFKMAKPTFPVPNVVRFFLGMNMG
jgi:hypothetical protein